MPSLPSIGHLVAQSTRHIMQIPMMPEKLKEWMLAPSNLLARQLPNLQQETAPLQHLKRAGPLVTQQTTMTAYEYAIFEQLQHVWRNTTNWLLWPFSRRSSPPAFSENEKIWLLMVAILLFMLVVGMEIMSRIRAMQRAEMAMDVEMQRRRASRRTDYGATWEGKQEMERTSGVDAESDVEDEGDEEWGLVLFDAESENA